MQLMALLALCMVSTVAAYSPSSSERSLNMQGQGGKQQAAQLLGRVIEHATKNPHVCDPADAALYPHLANAASDLSLQQAPDHLDEVAMPPTRLRGGGGYSGAGAYRKFQCEGANTSSRSARLPHL